MKIPTFIILLNHFLTVHCQWYKATQHQNETSGNELPSKSLPARSPIECILKCHIKCMESCFVEKKNQCYCLSRNEKPNSEEGVLYQENNVAECVENKV